MLIWACWLSYSKTMHWCGVSTPFCDYKSHHFSGNSFYKILECLFGICAQSLKSICEVRRWCWLRTPGWQWTFLPCPVVLSRFEVRALCRPIRFLHTMLIKPCLYGPYFARKGTATREEQRSSPNCCQKVGSTQLAKVSVEALRKPFTGTKELSLNPEKHP